MLGNIIIISTCETILNSRIIDDSPNYCVSSEYKSNYIYIY